MVRCLVAALLPLATFARDHWAVIVAGSNGYWNYRHQADACHAYHVARAKGIAEDHIIMMAYDDIVNDSQNPFPGQLFHKPTIPGVEGHDVYAGCNIDYKGADVTPQNFIDVLTGSASGKSLQSTSEDNVFIFFSDHGAPGLICFPADAGVLHKTQFQNTLQTMSDKKMFNKLTFYLETCESGSMFEDMNIPNVYALSAASPNEPSWGVHCGSEAQVDGKYINTCLGNLFSVNWMEDVDSSDTTAESLGDAFQVIKNKTSRSEVMQWGDVTFTDDKVSEFIGNQSLNLSISNLPSPVQSPRPPQVRRRATAETATDPAQSAISARQVDLARLYSSYTMATTSAERLQVGEELQQELAKQMAVDRVNTSFLQSVFPGDEATQEPMRTQKGMMDPAQSAISARQVDLARLYSLYTMATTSAERLQVGEELQQELAKQMAVDRIHTNFLQFVFPGDEATQELMRTQKVRPSMMECEMRVHQALMTNAEPHFDVHSGFALQFHQIVVNTCAEFAMMNGPVSQLEAAIQAACQGGHDVVVV